ncbi:MAG: hypothetical protein AB7F32_07255 [Victivallaceae bacterium]
MENTPVENPTPETQAPANQTPAKKPFRLKRYQKVLLFLLVIAVVVAVTINSVLSAVIVKSIRTVGPLATGTKVEIESVSVHLLRGRIELNNFIVGNPEGFSNKDALALKKLIFEVKPTSLMSDKIRVEELRVDGVAVSYEPSLQFKSNLGVIESNVNKFVSRLTGGAKKDDSAATAPAPEKKKQQILVKILSVRNVEVSVATLPAVPLPDIQIENVGEGKPLGDTVTEFFNELLKGIGKLGGDAGKLIGATASQLGDVANSAGKNLGDTAGKAADSVVEGISKLWKKTEETVK